MSSTTNQFIPRLFLALLVTAAIATASCGYADWDLPTPGVITGAEASAIINEAATTGSLVCAARTGRGFQFTYKADTDLIYGVEADRSYKQSDVDACAEGIMLTTALSGDCAAVNVSSAYFPTCKLTPVDKVTGN